MTSGEVWRGPGRPVKPKLRFDAFEGEEIEPSPTNERHERLNDTNDMNDDIIHICIYLYITRTLINKKNCVSS